VSNTYRAQNASIAFAVGSAQRGHLAAQRVLWLISENAGDEHELIDAARKELIGDPGALAAFAQWLYKGRAT
jgi:hypothetical protein